MLAQIRNSQIFKNTVVVRKILRDENELTQDDVSMQPAFKLVALKAPARLLL